MSRRVTVLTIPMEDEVDAEFTASSLRRRGMAVVELSGGVGLRLLVSDSTARSLAAEFCGDTPPEEWLGLNSDSHTIEAVCGDDVEPGDRILSYNNAIQVVSSVTRSRLGGVEVVCEGTDWRLLVAPGDTLNVIV